MRYFFIFLFKNKYSVFEIAIVVTWNYGYKHYAKLDYELNSISNWQHLSNVSSLGNKVIKEYQNWDKQEGIIMSNHSSPLRQLLRNFPIGSVEGWQ